MVDLNTPIWLAPELRAELAALGRAEVENRILVPQKKRATLDALRFEQLLIADGILDFATLAKEHVDDYSPVYASEKLVAIHSKTGGVKKITLPKTAAKVTEAFSGKVVAENAQVFEYDFAEPETALFELEF